MNLAVARLRLGRGLSRRGITCYYFRYYHFLSSLLLLLLCFALWLLLSIVLPIIIIS